jgi:hypothetical protein
MESGTLSGIVLGIVVAVIGEILARLVEQLRVDPTKMYRFSLIHLFSALLSLSICGLFLFLGFFTSTEIGGASAPTLTNGVAIAVSALGAFLFMYISFDKLLDGLTMLRRIDNYNEWAVYIDEELRKLSTS